MSALYQRKNQRRQQGSSSCQIKLTIYRNEADCMSTSVAPIIQATIYPDGQCHSTIMVASLDDNLSLGNSSQHVSFSHNDILKYNDLLPGFYRAACRKKDKNRIKFIESACIDSSCRKSNFTQVSSYQNKCERNMTAAGSLFSEYNSTYPVERIDRYGQRTQRTCQMLSGTSGIGTNIMNVTFRLSGNYCIDSSCRYRENRTDEPKQTLLSLSPTPFRKETMIPSENEMTSLPTITPIFSPPTSSQAFMTVATQLPTFGSSSSPTKPRDIVNLTVVESDSNESPTFGPIAIKYQPSSSWPTGSHLFSDLPTQSKVSDQPTQQHDDHHASSPEITTTHGTQGPLHVRMYWNDVNQTLPQELLLQTWKNVTIKYVMQHYSLIALKYDNEKGFDKSLLTRSNQSEAKDDTYDIKSLNIDRIGQRLIWVSSLSLVNQHNNGSAEMKHVEPFTTLAPSSQLGYKDNYTNGFRVLEINCSINMEIAKMNNSTANYSQDSLTETTLDLMIPHGFNYTFLDTMVKYYMFMSAFDTEMERKQYVVDWMNSVGEVPHNSTEILNSSSTQRWNHLRDIHVVVDKMDAYLDVFLNDLNEQRQSQPPVNDDVSNSYTSSSTNYPSSLVDQRDDNNQSKNSHMGRILAISLGAILLFASYALLLYYRGKRDGQREQGQHHQHQDSESNHSDMMISTTSTPDRFNRQQQPHLRLSSSSSYSSSTLSKTVTTSASAVTRRLSNITRKGYVKTMNATERGSPRRVVLEPSLHPPTNSTPDFRTTDTTNILSLGINRSHSHSSQGSRENLLPAELYENQSDTKKMIGLDHRNA